MAESAAFTRHGYVGGAKSSTVPAGLASGATSTTAADLSTWVGVSTNGPFMFVLDPGLTTEEVCEATTLSGNNITGITRGLRGTAAVAHDPNCVIKHVSTDRDFDEANRLVNAILGIAGLTAGDLLTVLSATTFGRLAKGTAYQSLNMNAGATAQSYMASMQSLMTAAGDIVIATGANTPARLAKGAAYQALQMDAAGSLPTWGTTLSSLLTAQGDLPFASAANTPARLAKGTAWQRLRQNSGLTAPEWFSQSGCKVHQAVPATITSGATAYQNFDTEDYDTDAYHSTVSNTNRITVPVAGKYLIIGYGGWAANATGLRQFVLRKNGLTTLASVVGMTVTTASEQMYENVTWIGDLAVNDYVELGVRQNSGGNLALDWIEFTLIALI